jgi:hypothetical protein
LELKGEAIFDIPLMIQSHAKSMKKILVALYDLPAQPIQPNFTNYASYYFAKKALKGFKTHFKPCFFISKYFKMKNNNNRL